MSRYAIRVGHADPADLAIPFAHYGERITHVTQMDGCPRRDNGGFPNVKRWLWTQNGENVSYHSWYGVFELENGLFGFCTSWPDDEGWTEMKCNCEGGFELLIGTWEEIVDHAMDEQDYEIYVEQTRVESV